MLVLMLFLLACVFRLALTWHLSVAGPLDMEQDSPQNSPQRRGAWQSDASSRHLIGATGPALVLPRFA